MPLRDFRNVEYYRIQLDDSWDIQTMLVPFEIPYEHCIDYIFSELVGLNLTDNLGNIAICSFPDSVAIASLVHHEEGDT